MAKMHRPRPTFTIKQRLTRYSCRVTVRRVPWACAGQLQHLRQSAAMYTAQQHLHQRLLIHCSVGLG